MTNSGKGLRVLLVDDEIGFTNVLCKRMARRGFEPTSAFSGEEAVLKLRTNRFDLAIVDLKLEGIDGVEILKVFKLMAPKMPVLMLTGHGCEQAHRACMKLGAQGYLSKPIDFDTLLTKAVSVGSLGVGV